MAFTEVSKKHINLQEHRFNQLIMKMASDCHNSSLCYNCYKTWHIATKWQTE